MQAAVGRAVTGKLRFDYAAGGKLALSDIALGGADYALTGNMTLDGIEGQVEAIVTPDLVLRAERLARFGPLAGLELGGAARLAIKGTARPVSGKFDLDLAGETQDLATGVARLDPLLDGAGEAGV